MPPSLIGAEKFDISGLNQIHSRLLSEDYQRIEAAEHPNQQAPLMHTDAFSILRILAKSKFPEGVCVELRIEQSQPGLVPLISPQALPVILTGAT